jgi:uncharacterized protein (TIGR02646 family)
MIQLSKKDLSKDVQDELNRLQSQIDHQKGFTERIQKAQLLWNTKGGIRGKTAFNTISTDLLNLCVYIGVCNYCEQNEANDIEHIYPKSFFPESTFKWENYLLACKQCNSGIKLDQCHVLDQNSDVLKLQRGDEPPFQTISFINPRIETPNDYMILNTLSHKFEVFDELDKKRKNKAHSTLEILELNTRDILIQARKSAANHYYEKISRLARILNANTIDELAEALTPYDDLFDLNQPIDSIKNSIKDSYKKYISSYQHPSVWYSIKIIESQMNKKWQALFAQIPEALNW